MAQHFARTQLNQIHARGLPGVTVETESLDAKEWEVTVRNLTSYGPGGEQVRPCPLAMFAATYVSRRPHVFFFCVFVDWQLDRDLQRHAQTFGTDGALHFRIVFGENCPLEPPQVALERPILQTRTGGIDGGVPCIPVLFRQGWDPDMSMIDVLQWVVRSIAQKNGRVDLRTDNAYPKAAFEACYFRIVENRRTMARLGTSDGFKWPFFVASASFAREVFDEIAPQIPPDFEAGNKVVLPSNVMNELRDHLSTAALTFELESHHGVRTYCGMGGAHASGDNDDIIIVPDWMIASMHVLDMMEVRLTPVEVPPMRAMQILPLSHEFGDLPDPKAYLQFALTKYSCIGNGEVIQLSGDGRDLSFYVTGLFPNVPAATVWTGDWETEVSLDILPPQDQPRNPEENRGNTAEWGVVSPEPPLRRHPSGTSVASDADRDRRRPRRGTAAQASGMSQEERNAEFANYMARMQQRQDQAEQVQVTRGIPLDREYNPEGEQCRVRVRLMPVPITLDDFPSNVTLLVNPTTSLRAIYSFVRDNYTLPGVDFRFVRAQDDSWIPDSPTTTVQQLQLANRVIEQQMRQGSQCDACVRLRQPAQAQAARQLSQEDQAHVDRLRAEVRKDCPDIWPCPQCTYSNDWNSLQCMMCEIPRLTPDDARAALLAAITDYGVPAEEPMADVGGGDDDQAHDDAADASLRTFIVHNGTVTLCEQHPCQWLEMLFASPALTRSDLPLVTPERVLDYRTARLV